MLKILTVLHTLPDVKSYRTLFFENLLPVLKTKTDVHITWFVYNPDKLNPPIQEEPGVTVLDIHNYKNAIEVIQKVKPDIIYVAPNLNFPDYAFALAGKFLKIPVIGELVNELFIKTSFFALLRSYMEHFFQSSVPTDKTENQKQFMRRGRFFFYKYLFLMKTQRAIGISIFDIILSFFSLVKSHFTVYKHLHDSRFALDLHFVENETLIESLVNEGFKKSTLVVTGNPMYDSEFRKMQKFKSSLNKDGKIRILLLTHAMYEHGIWTRKQRDSLVRSIVTEISRHKLEMSLVVKIHPSSEILFEYQSLINPIDSSIPIHQSGDAMDFFGECDIVITYSAASAVVNALVLGKPIIICNFFNLERDLFLDRGLASECKRAIDLIPLIKQAISSNPATRDKIDDFIRECFYKFDGKASERISNAILELRKSV